MELSEAPAREVPEGRFDFRDVKGQWLVLIAFLLVVDYLLYFRQFDHFFSPDTLWGFTYRLRSFSEFWHSFYSLDPGGWYRPLANRTIQSVLFPFLGFGHFTLYRLVLVPFFFANILGVYYLTLLLSGRHLAALIAATFISLHSVNAYVTYDVAFFCELANATFYLGGAISAWHYIRHGTRSAKWLSLTCYVLGLLTKEPGVTLPATIAVIAWFESELPNGSIPNRIRQVLRVTGWHWVAMAIYMAFVVGYLHVGGGALDTLLTKPAEENGSYHMVLDQPMILHNIDVAFSWAFNLPRGWHGQWRDLSPWMLRFLEFFRAIAVFSAAALLFGRKRNVVFIGLAWFVIAVSPMLLLRDHFVPYYIYLPTMGLSVIIGTAFEAAVSSTSRMWALRFASVSILFIVLGVVCRHGIRNDIAHHSLLGASAKQAGQSLADMKRLHPTLPKDAKIYFFNDHSPGLPYSQVSGGLFRVAYLNDFIEVGYSSIGNSIPPFDANTNSLFVFNVRRDDGLVDVTDDLKIHPEHYAVFRDDARYTLQLSAQQIHAGEGYDLTISGLKNCVVQIFYELNEGTASSFATRLDGGGRTHFSVGPDTPVGHYRFLGFTDLDSRQSYRGNADIVVQ